MFVLFSDQQFQKFDKKLADKKKKSKYFDLLRSSSFGYSVHFCNGITCKNPSKFLLTNEQRSYSIAMLFAWDQKY